MGHARKDSLAFAFYIHNLLLCTGKYDEFIMGKDVAQGHKLQTFVAAGNVFAWVATEVEF